MVYIGIFSKYESEIKDLYYLFIRYLKKDDDHRLIKAALDERLNLHRVLFRKETNFRSYAVYAPVINMDSGVRDKMNIMSISRMCNPILLNIVLEKSLEKQMDFLNYFVKNLNLRYDKPQNVSLLLSKVNFFDKMEMKKLKDDAIRTIKDVFSKIEIIISDVLYIYKEVNDDQQIIDFNDQMIKRIINLVEYKIPKTKDILKSIVEQLKVDKELYKKGRKTIEDYMESLDKQFINWDKKENKKEN